MNGVGFGAGRSGQIRGTGRGTQSGGAAREWKSLEKMVGGGRDPLNSCA